MKSMKKRLTEAEFQAAIKRLEVGRQTIEIARGVLVEGKPQADYVAALGVTKGAVWQAVKRVWDAHIRAQETPEGFERITVVLPEHQAFIVKKWAQNAKESQGTKT